MDTRAAINALGALLLVVTVPSTAIQVGGVAAAPADTLPTEPGCFLRRPRGCPKHPELDGTDWKRAVEAESFGTARVNRTACEVDAKAAMVAVCGTEEVEALFVPPGGPELEKLPAEPGCFARKLKGCPNHPAFNSTSWKRAEQTEKLRGAKVNRTACEVFAKAALETFCGTTDVEVLFVPEAAERADGGGEGAEQADAGNEASREAAPEQQAEADAGNEASREAAPEQQVEADAGNEASREAAPEQQAEADAGNEASREAAPEQQAEVEKASESAEPLAEPIPSGGLDGDKAASADKSGSEREDSEVDAEKSESEERERAQPPVEPSPSVDGVAGDDAVDVEESESERKEEGEHLTEQSPNVDGVARDSTVEEAAEHPAEPSPNAGGADDQMTVDDAESEVHREEAAEPSEEPGLVAGGADAAAAVEAEKPAKEESEEGWGSHVGASWDGPGGDENEAEADGKAPAETTPSAERQARSAEGSEEQEPIESSASLSSGGCFVRTPMGCPSHPSFASSEWKREDYGQRSTRLRANRTVCEVERRAQVAHWCGAEDVEMLFVPALEPGCYVRTPLGCPNHPSFSSMAWKHEAYGEDHTAAKVNRTMCEVSRKVHVVSWCGTEDVQMRFVPANQASLVTAGDEANRSGKLRLPVEPGCFIRTPTGCPNHPAFHSTEWKHEEYGENNTPAKVNSTVCVVDRKMHVAHWCGADDVEAHFIPGAEPAQS